MPDPYFRNILPALPVSAQRRHSLRHPLLQPVRPVSSLVLLSLYLLILSSQPALSYISSQVMSGDAASGRCRCACCCSAKHAGGHTCCCSTAAKGAGEKERHRSGETIRNCPCGSEGQARIQGDNDQKLLLISFVNTTPPFYPPLHSSHCQQRTIWRCDKPPVPPPENLPS